MSGRRRLLCRQWRGLLAVLVCWFAGALVAQELPELRATEPGPEMALSAEPITQEAVVPQEAVKPEETAAPQELPLAGDAGRGRLVFGPCRTCHYAELAMGHNNGPNLHRIFGKVAGKQAGFAYYSEVFREAQFVWTPRLMFSWLENPMAMFPGSSMMSLGVPDPQQRADLIAFLQQASVREP